MAKPATVHPLELHPLMPVLSSLCSFIDFSRRSRFLFFFLIHLFIYLFLAVLGLRFCTRAFSSCGERGPLFIAVHGPFTVAASFVAAHRPQMRRLSSCGSRAQWLRGMWDPPRPGLKPVSPALAGRFSTTAPPGKPLLFFFKSQNREYSEINHLSLVPANMVQDQS